MAHRTRSWWRCILLLTILGAVALPGVAAQGQTASEAVVEAARQVTTSADPVRAFVGPQIAVHPNEPLTVVGFSAEARSGGCRLFASRDGGLSWTTTAPNVLPDGFDYCVQNNYGRHSAVAFAPDGTFYASFGASSIAEAHPNGPVTQMLLRSDDLGETFETAVVAEPGMFPALSAPEGESGEPPMLPGEQRYSSLAIDPDDPDNVYVGWRLTLADAGFEGETPQPQTYVASSTDGGRTFSEPVNLTEVGDIEGLEGSDYAQMVVGDGTVYAFSKERPADAPEGEPRPISRLFMWKSEDQGQTWTGAVIRDTAQDTDSVGDAVYEPASGTLLIAWGERGDRPEEGPRLAISPYVMRSTDGGETWSDPLLLVSPDIAEAYDQYWPALSVAPDGRVDAAWHDFQNDPFFAHTDPDAEAEARYSDVYYAFSTDQGQSFSEPIRVTDRSIDRDIGVTMGDNFVVTPPGLTSTEATAYLAWADSRAGTPVQPAEDVYFTRIRLGEGAAPLTVTGGGFPVVPTLLGAAAALILAGLAVGIAATRVPGRSRARQAA